MQTYSSALTKPLFICGPCSAENETQVLESAYMVQSLGVKWFRAGLWKPRTRPSEFEGVGSKGLEWLKKAKETFGLKICTEVAKPSHVEMCLKYGFDALWLGTRTVANPFSVQEISESLKGVKDVILLVKNPMIPDVKLWLGAIERIEKQSLTTIAVHRGFSLIENTPYRQSPLWRIPLALKQERQDLMILCDPSHIAGRRDLVKDIAQQSANIGFDGLMIETHYDPDNALTDSKQQLSKEDLQTLLNEIHFPKNNEINTSLSVLRDEINGVDKDIILAIKRRMLLSEEIGKIKKEDNLPIFQSERWQEVLNSIISQAENMGLDKVFVKEIYEIIHQESIKTQNIIINKSKK